MSKNLEREYRALVNSEVPDLWARIEAGLEDKQTAPEKKETDLNITDLSKTDSQLENVRGKKVNFKAWAGLAAACVCVALIVPAMARSMIMGGDSSSYSNSASSDTLQNDTPQAAESYEKAESARPEAADEAVANDAAAADDNGMNDSANAAVTSDTDTINVNSGALEEPYSFQVTVEIRDTGVSRKDGTLYTAKAITSENPDIEADSEIKILSPTMILEDSKTYDLMLSVSRECTEDSGGETIYVLINDAAE